MKHVLQYVNWHAATVQSGQTNDYSTHSGQTNDYSTQSGQTNDYSTQSGQTNDYSMQSGQTNDYSTNMVLYIVVLFLLNIILNKLYFLI